MRDKPPHVCAACGSRREPGSTTFTADIETGIVVIREVPALVCTQCGSDWIADETAAKIEELVHNARKSRRQVEITTLAS